ncbi:MAG: helix-turn-helix transcriptional regulator [Verrucomicrobia bacterium]|nr:helix-turn-helix transcriptional regulator [Verrucomicrobiota bacterium]
MSLACFLGQDLVVALGRLTAERVLGPWRGARPRDRRRRMKFAPVLYGEDHAHEHAELCLLLEGRCRFSCEHAGSVLEAGDLVVCPARLPHAEAYVRPAGGYRLAWWSLHESEPRLHVTRYARRGGFRMEHLMDLALLPADARGRIAALREMAAGPRPPSAEALREALLTLTLALYRRVLDGGEAQLDSRAHLVRRAADYVRTQAGRALTLAEVARAARVSPNYLTGLFRAETGTSLGRFILAERVALAQRRLRLPGATVKAVALDLGFADPFTFSRAFKRVTGRSPTAWQSARPT